MNLHAKNLALFISLALLSISFHLSAQDCSLSVNKDALKNYNKAIECSTESEKHLLKKVNYLKEAVRIDPYFYAAIWELTSFQLNYPDVSDISLADAKENLLFIVKDCPGFHSSPYYLLGQLYQGEKNNDKAKEFYKAFIEFSHSEYYKYDRENYNLYRDEAKEFLAALKRTSRMQAEEPEVKIGIEGNQLTFAAPPESIYAMSIVEVNEMEQGPDEDNLYMIRGYLRSKTGNRVFNTQMKVVDTYTNKTYNLEVDKVNGEFKVVLETAPSAHLKVAIEKQGMPTLNYMVSGLKADQLLVREIKDNAQLEPQVVCFKSTSIELTSSNKEILNALAVYMQENEGLVVCIENYTHQLEDSSKNKMISEQRAQTLRTYLINKGVKSDRIKMQAKGDHESSNLMYAKEDSVYGNHSEFVILQR